MKKATFIKELPDVLEIDEELTEESNLRDFKEYDSLAVLSLVAFIDEKFGMSLSSDELAEVATVRSLIELIGEENFD